MSDVGRGFRFEFGAWLNRLARIAALLVLGWITIRAAACWLLRD